jgi:RNA polymerase sigma-70 factor (ECF subfamily)
LRAIGGDDVRDEVDPQSTNSWEALYREHHEAVFRHASYLMGDPAAAEDLTQEAFATAFCSMTDFDQRGSFLSWTRGIALNLARMHWRRAKTTLRAHESLRHQQHATPASRRDAPDLAHEQQRRMQALYGVLGGLPEHLREVFTLRDLEGLPVSEVAVLLEITPNNVRVRANRARAKIRDRLREQGLLAEENA